jgi:hypothetical protein
MSQVDIAYLLLVLVAMGAFAFALAYYAHR